jgi:hypothetical protein
MKTALCRLWIVGLTALPIAACNQTASAPTAMTASASATPSSFHMPEGTGCKGEVDRYRAVMSNDLTMGHVNQSVYTKVEREIGQAEAACATGRDADALRMIRATKTRYGYI